ncbi:hypothetical protein GUJ93_ZPchr0008g11401 [Zizania palustris]|uniref:Uncharacterized protein n=1 Tax=Zizania palustris TaxID=103762 RepID=A0A8J5V3K5_ZIZPA|nr:hypothetical protein GUJ93_ZPchr0008g11401 [Zizania palustris]
MQAGQGEEKSRGTDLLPRHPIRGKSRSDGGRGNYCGGQSTVGAGLEPRASRSGIRSRMRRRPTAERSRGGQTSATFQRAARHRWASGIAGPEVLWQQSGALGGGATNVRTSNSRVLNSAKIIKHQASLLLLLLAERGKGGVLVSSISVEL